MPIFSNSRPPLRKPPVPPPLPVARCPWLVGEGGRLAGKQIRWRLALQRLDLGADPVAQRFEPDLCFGALPFGKAGASSLMVSVSDISTALSERARALQLIAALQPREQIDHPDHAILDRP